MYVMSSNITSKECNSNCTVYCRQHDMNCENGSGVLLPWLVTVGDPFGIAFIYNVHKYKTITKIALLFFVRC